MRPCSIFVISQKQVIFWVRSRIFRLFLAGLLFFLTIHVITAYVLSASPGVSGTKSIRHVFGATFILPFSSSLEEGLAKEAGRSLALIQSLAQASDLISAFTSVRLTLNMTRNQALNRAKIVSALASVALPIYFSTAKSHSGKFGLVHSSVDIFVPPAIFEEKIRHVLLSEDIIERKSEILLYMLSPAEEAANLLKKKLNDKDAYLKRIKWLSSRLHSLNNYWSMFDIHDKFDTLEKSDFDAASLLKKLEEIAEEDRDNPLILAHMAELCLVLNRLHEAISLIDRCLEFEPNLARGIYIRGLVNLRLNLPALALRDFNQAISMQDNKSSWYITRALAFMRQHEEEAMCRDLHHACRLGNCADLMNMRKENLCLTGG